MARLHQAVLRDVHAKETLLYREHIAQQKAFEDEISDSYCCGVTAERDQAAVKAARLDQLVSFWNLRKAKSNGRLRDTVESSRVGCCV